MGSERRPTSMDDFHPPYTHDQTVAERKAAALRRHEEFQEERQKQLHAQTSPSNSPAERIRIWERFHELQLPRDPNHRLLAIIACQTALEIADLRAEQQRRCSIEKELPAHT